MQKEILAVIVLYNCNICQSKTYKTLDRNNCKLLVYDNSPYVMSSITPSEYYYKYNGENKGLSFCYNRAAEFAKKFGYKWILLLDQDTDLSTIKILDYLKAIEKNPTINLIAPAVKSYNSYMSPIDVHRFLPRMDKEIINRGVLSFDDYSLINSGMCIKIDAFVQCGGYNENVFLDYSDYQFIERFKKYNTKFVLLSQDVYQNYSGMTDDKKHAEKRYILFYNSINNLETECVKLKLSSKVVLFKRALALLIYKRTLKPLAYFMRKAFLL